MRSGINPPWSAIKAKTDELPYVTPGKASGITLQEVDAFGTGTPTRDNVVSNVAANTFGSYQELIASTSADWLWVGITCRSVTNEARFVCIELATGAAGSETVFARISFRQGASSATVNPWIYNCPIPIPIPSGSRISGRCSDDQADTEEYTISCQFIQGM